MNDHPLLRAIDPAEIRSRASADGHLVVVTDDRLLVGSDTRIVLDIALEGLRRIQFDIELHRRATLVIVPVSPHDEPQVIVVRPGDYESIVQALALIGHRLDAITDRDQTP